MSVQIQTPTGTVTTTTTQDFDIDTVGIEFEYPVASDEPGRPLDYARRSRDLRNYDGSEWDETGLSGYVGRDHVGAEITSGQLSLHTTEPFEWYRGVIEFAEDHGFPFAQVNEGATAFGLHHHLSELADDQASALNAASDEPWMRVFACSSVSRYSADPWRHYGRRVRGRRGAGHYEWRLPEPCPPEQHAMIIDFLRRIELTDVDLALEWAQERVYERDERLQAISQFEWLQENVDGWPDEQAMRPTNDTRGTDPETAEFLRDLVE